MEQNTKTPMASRDESSQATLESEAAGSVPPESSQNPDEAQTMLTDTASISQKVADVVLGAVVLVGETAVEVARNVSTQGPGWLENLEAKGKPVREQFGDWFRTTFANSYRDWSYDEAARPEATPILHETSAEEEISALERRARELEQQVAAQPSVPSAEVAPSPPALPEAPVTNEISVPPVVSDAVNNEYAVENESLETPESPDVMVAEDVPSEFVEVPLSPEVLTPDLQEEFRTPADDVTFSTLTTSASLVVPQTPEDAPATDDATEIAETEERETTSEELNLSKEVQTSVQTGSLEKPENGV